MVKTPNHPREHEDVLKQGLLELSRRPSPCPMDSCKSCAGIPPVDSLCFYSHHTCVSIRDMFGRP